MTLSYITPIEVEWPKVHDIRDYKVTIIDIDGIEHELYFSPATESYRYDAASDSFVLELVTTPPLRETIRFENDGKVYRVNVCACFRCQEYRRVRPHRLGYPFCSNNDRLLKSWSVEPEDEPLLSGCPVIDQAKTGWGQDVVRLLAKGEQRRGTLSELIEKCEKRGQDELIWAAGAVLPWRGSQLEDLAELGFSFGDRYDDHALFRRAVLPADWSLVADPDNEYLSSLQDPAGRARFWVYYKATPGSARAEIRRDKF
jgi:hypothetical protein